MPAIHKTAMATILSGTQHFSDIGQTFGPLGASAIKINAASQTTEPESGSCLGRRKGTHFCYSIPDERGISQDCIQSLGYGFEHEETVSPAAGSGPDQTKGKSILEERKKVLDELARPLVAGDIRPATQ